MKRLPCTILSIIATVISLGRYKIIDSLSDNPEEIEKELERIRELEKKKEQEEKEKEKEKKDKENLSIENKNEDKNEKDNLLQNDLNVEKQGDKNNNIMVNVNPMNA